jgi:phosphoglycolate phosphatase-like HAD superfamily hydrolase
MNQLRDAVIFDMDGTLCDVRSIRHLINGPGGFDAFHQASIDCPPHEWVVEAAREAHAAGQAVLIVTGRAQKHRNVTAMWLALHNVPSDGMWMRRNGDFRKDFIVKREILARIRQRFNPVRAWDDNPNVLDLWRQENIPVTVVPGWDGPVLQQPDAVQLSFEEQT